MSVIIDLTYLGDLHCEATHGPSRKQFCRSKGDESNPAGQA